MSAVEPQPKSKVLEATLELGRNWALATALAAFSVSMIGQEAIHGVAQHKAWLEMGGIILALLWYWLAVARAGQVAEFKSDTRRRRSLLAAGGLALLFLGMGIVYAMGSFSDNRRYIQICTDYADKPGSGVFRDEACQRLYRQRVDFAERLDRINPAPATE